MTRIYVDTEDELPVTEIAWKNSCGSDEHIVLDADLVDIVPDDSGRIHAKDIPKLIKALEKAMELGWHEA